LQDRKLNTTYFVSPCSASTMHMRIEAIILVGCLQAANRSLMNMQMA